MSIEVKIEPSEELETPKGKKQKEYTVSLNIRKTVDGKIVIGDHTEIDIVLIPDKMKVLVFPKDMSSQIGYDTQNAYLKFLQKKGMVKYETVRAGNIFNSLQADIPEAEEPDKYDPIQLTIFATSIFIEEDRENFIFAKKIRDEFEKRLLQPDEEESTELGEVPHAERKGSIPYYGSAVPSSHYNLRESKED